MNCHTFLKIRFFCYHIRRHSDERQSAKHPPAPAEDHRASTWGEWSGWLGSGHGTGVGVRVEYRQYNRETAGLSCSVASPRDPFLHKAPRPHPATSVESQPLKWHDPTPFRSRNRTFHLSSRDRASISCVIVDYVPRRSKTGNSGLIGRC